MATKEFTVDIDLVENALVRAVLEPVTSDPTTPADGRIWYRTDLDKFYARINGATFQVVTAEDQLQNNYAASLAPSTTDDAASGYAVGSIWIDTTNDESYICADSTNSAAVWLNTSTDPGGGSTNLSWTASTRTVASDTGTDAIITLVTGTDAGLMSSADKNKLDAITGTNTGDEAAASDTVAGVVELATIAETQTGTDATRAVTPDSLQGVTNVAGYAWVLDTDTLSEDDATKVPTQQSVKAYVDASVSSSLTYKGGYNASTNTPDLDTSPTGVLTGDTYTVTAAGTFFSTAVEVGDTLIAETDSASLEADWTIVNRNIDAATATVPGIVELATSAEATTGTDTTRALTPEALANSKYGVAKYTENIGDGSTNPITVTHNLGSTEVVVAIRRVSDGAQVEAEVTVTNSNALSIEFNTPATTNQYFVTVVG